MPFFRRKSDKSQPVPSGQGKVGVKRTPSSASTSSSVRSASPDGSGNALPQLLLVDDTESDLGAYPSKTPMRTSSRLSKTLQEIIHDRDALPLFIDFMTSQKADKFIRFWLDAESFQTATLTRKRTHAARLGSTSPSTETTNTKTKPEKTNVDSVAGVVNSETNSKSESENTEIETGVVNSETNPKSENRKIDTSVDNSETNPKSELKNTNIDTSVVNSETRVSTVTKNNRSVNKNDASANSAGDPSGSNHGTPSGNAGSSERTDHSVQEPSKESVSHKVKHSVNNSNPDGQINGNRPKSPGTLRLADATNQSANDPISSNQPCDTNTVKTRHLSEPVTSEETINSSTPSPKLRHCSDSTVPSTQTEIPRKARPALTSEELKEKLKKSIAHDAVNIFTKYISQDAPEPIGVTDELRNETISNICKEDGEVDPCCFSKCQQFALDIIQKKYFESFQDSEYHCKHQVDILTSGQVYLPDILYNEMALVYFMEFLEREEVCHLLQFWIAVDNFQNHLASQQGQYDGMQAQTDAMVFYDKYFSLQASQPLGFDDNVRFEVESNICREEGPLPDVFAKPKDIVLKTLDRVYFGPFLRSEMYYKYLSDLISTVNMAQDLPAKLKRKGSDASSEHSGGSQSVGGDSLSNKNTLLAMDSSSIKKALNKLNVDMRIDSHLLNPEDLWKRPTENKMSLGCVNRFGQFVSEFTPEPDHKEKKITFFKKSRLKEKEKEDMALQIAQMIINDVATMTKTGDLCSGKEVATSSSAIKNQDTPKL